MFANLRIYGIHSVRTKFSNAMECRFAGAALLPLICIKLSPPIEKSCVFHNKSLCIHYGELLVILTRAIHQFSWCVSLDQSAEG